MRAEFKLAGLLSVFLILTFFFTGCEVKNESPFTQTDYPAAAGEIIINSKPQRVICLSPSYTEIIYELGLEGSLAGRSDNCSYPRDVLKLPSVGDSLNLKIEKVKEIKPDLIISQSNLPEKNINELYSQGIKVLVLKPAEKISDMEYIYKDIAVALAGNIQGKPLGENGYKAFSDTIKKVASSIPKKKPTFLYSIDLESIFATPDTFESDVLSLIGENFITIGQKYSADFGDNKINPDIIFINEPFEAEDAKQSKLLKSSPAVQKGDIYVINPKWFETRSIRLADNIKKIAKLIYPNLK